MEVSTETSTHDDSRDNKKQFDRTFEDIFGKAWYERDDEEEACT